MWKRSVNVKRRVGYVSIWDHEDTHSSSRKWGVVDLGSGPGSPLKSWRSPGTDFVQLLAEVIRVGLDTSTARIAARSHPVTTCTMSRTRSRANIRGDTACLHLWEDSLRSETSWSACIRQSEVHQTFLWWGNPVTVVEGSWPHLLPQDSQQALSRALACQLVSSRRLLFCRARTRRPSVSQSQPVPVSWSCLFCDFSNKTTLRTSYEPNTMLGIEDRVPGYVMILFFWKSSSKQFLRGHLSVTE